MDWLDAIYMVFLALVLVGGSICIAIFVPKEKKLQKSKGNSYRFYVKNGEMKMASSVPSLTEEENRYFYLEKGPYEVDCFADGIVGKDGGKYKSVSLVNVYVPESTALKAAEHFSKLSQDAVVAVVSEALSAALEDTLKEYSNGDDPQELNRKFRETADKKLAIFGLLVFSADRVAVGVDTSEG